MSSQLNIRNISLGYPGLMLCQNLSLDIENGSTLAVLGANGSGKSTFVKTLLGLNAPLAGQLVWPNGRPNEIGYLAQMSEFDRRFPIRVRELAAMGAWKGFGLFGHQNRSTRMQVDAALDAAGVYEISNKSIHTLSGGQLQRTLFARVIMQDAPLIVLDEPFAAVDQKTQAHLLSLIGRWRDEGRAIVMVLHDLSSVLDCCDHVLLLGDGQATYGSVDSVLTPERLVAQNYLSQSQASWMFRSTANRPENNSEQSNA